MRDENGKIVYPDPFQYECCIMSGYKRRLTEYAQDLEEVIEELKNELRNKKLINEREIALQIRDMLIENAKEIAKLEHDLQAARLANEVLVRENEMLTSQMAVQESQERAGSGKFVAEINKATKCAIAATLAEKSVPEDKIAKLLNINISSVRQYVNNYKKNKDDHFFQEKIDTKVLNWFRTGKKPA